jgi:hypothetical protein
MTTQTITLAPNPLSPQILRLNTVPQEPAEVPEEQHYFQPFIDDLRIVYLRYIDNEDTLSVKIRNVADNFIKLDGARIATLSEMLRISQDCKRQFAKVLVNDLDKAELDEPAPLSDYVCERWHLEDFIKLDKYFGRRDVALSPFDGSPIPNVLAEHEFAKAIIEILNTIPEMVPEAVVPPMTTAVNPTTAVAIPNQQQVVALPPSRNAAPKMSRADAEAYPPEIPANLAIAYQRYTTWKTLAKASVKERKYQAIAAQVSIDLAAQKLANENALRDLINEQARQLGAYYEEEQKITQDQLEGFEKTRDDVRVLQTQLEEATKNIQELRTRVRTQETRSEDLQQQIRVQQANYNRLAQEIQEIRNSCKKKKKKFIIF